MTPEEVATLDPENRERKASENMIASQLLRQKFLCEMSPRDPQAFRRFGQSLAACDRHEEAAAAFRRALALKPDDPLVLNQLGMAYVRLGQRRKAVDIFKNLLRVAPKYAVAHYNYGLCLLGMNLVDEAVGMLEAAVALNPKSEAMRADLAAAYHRAGRPESALAEYAKAHELNPRNFTLLERMSAIHEELGDLAEALTLAETAEKAARNHPRHEALLENHRRLNRLYRERYPAAADDRKPDGPESFLEFLSAPLEPSAGTADGTDLVTRLGEKLRRDADDYTVLEEMARAFEEKGEFDRALEVTRRLVLLLKNKLESVQDILTRPDLTA